MLLIFGGYGIGAYIAPTVRTVTAMGRSTDLTASHRVPDVTAPHRDTGMTAGHRPLTVGAGSRSVTVTTVLPTTTTEPPQP